jgi:hypothetical protein
MAKPSNFEDLDLETIRGRLSYAIKMTGATAVSNNTSISRAQVNRLSSGQGSTTLENAAEIAMATGFELKWIALGQGPMKIDDELWEHTNSFSKITQLDDNQNADFSFDPEFLAQQKVTADQCRVWEVDCHVELPNLKRGHTVLIDTEQKKGSGTFVLKSNDQTLVGDIHMNLDGSAKFKTDMNNSDTDQQLSTTQLEGLTIIGRVIWQAGQS